MNTLSYDIIIDHISEPFGAYPGFVDVNSHLEGGDLADGQRDGFESNRVALTEACVNEDDTYNPEEITKAVRAKIGETQAVEDEA